MFREFIDEKWKELQHDEYYSEKAKIYLSNYGRIKWLWKDAVEYELKKPCVTHNFYSSYFHREKKRSKTFYVHKMVAQLFIEKTKDDRKFVIHLDHDLKNNHISNLKYVNQKELTAHQQTNPKVIEARKNRKRSTVGHKLTETQVKLIKRKIFDPNRKTRLRLIAKQFGISEMQLYRIKTGENWGHVKEY